MQRLAVLPAVLVSSVPALAHPVHVAQESGHTHWLGLAAVGAAVLVAIVGYVRGTVVRRRREAFSADSK